MKVLKRKENLLCEEIEIKRVLKIEMSNGTVFNIKEDIEGHLEITKEDSEDGSSLSVFPRYANQITLN